MNGINTTALADFAAAVTADPKAGEARFAVDTHWQGASRSRAHVSSYYLAEPAPRTGPTGIRSSGMAGAAHRDR